MIDFIFTAIGVLVVVVIIAALMVITGFLMRSPVQRFTGYEVQQEDDETWSVYRVTYFVRVGSIDPIAGVGRCVVHGLTEDAALLERSRLWMMESQP